MPRAEDKAAVHGAGGKEEHESELESGYCSGLTDVRVGCAAWVKLTPIWDDLGNNILDAVVCLATYYFCRDRAFRYFFVAVSLWMRYKGSNGLRQCYQHRRSPDHKSPSEKGGFMAAHKSSKRKKPYQRVHKFPTAKGKIIADVELSISPDYNIIEIIFQDKTSLCFDLESRVHIAPELVSWKSGSYKPLKRWRSVLSF